MKRLAAVIGIGLCVGGAAACAELLGLNDGAAAPEAVGHRPHVIEGVACTRCHAGMDRAGDHAQLHIPSSVTCTGCHEDGCGRGTSCTSCHVDEVRVRHAAQARRYVTFSHAEHLEEEPGRCVICHRGVAEEAPTLGVPMSVCIGCHEHRDGLSSRQCENCHIDLAREGTVPDSHLVHADGWTERHGTAAGAGADLCSTCHTERHCAGCHGATVAALPSTLTFDDPFGFEIHRAGFASRHAEEAAAEPGLCTTCHAEHFCNGCHERRRVSPRAATSRNPHPAGWIGILGAPNLHGEAARRDPSACASCHGGAGELLCVECHRVGGIGGRPHPPGWSSRRELSEAPCRMCHLGLGR